MPSRFAAIYIDAQLSNALSLLARGEWYQVSASDEEGQREFLIQDPDGYLLRFAEYLGRRHVE